MLELLWSVGWIFKADRRNCRLLKINQEIYQMRSFISIAALLVLCALMGVGAGYAQEGDGVRRITPEEARHALDTGKAIIVDVRDEGAYKAGHAKGALWIPVNEIESRIKELPRDKMIIAYCS